MAKDQVSAVHASVHEATAPERVVIDAEQVGNKVYVLGHFLRLMGDLTCGGPGGRSDVCSESFSVVMDELAERCMAAGAEISQLGNRVGHG